MICDRSMINPTAAWEDALELRSYELDQAISQSQVLYFISTMDGFVPPKKPSSQGDDQGDATKRGDQGDSKDAKSCAANAACAELGLTGNCCPSPTGVYLGCCDAENQKDGTSNAPPAQPPSSSAASCAANSACIPLGLTGNCCPTPGGAELDCCDSNS